MKQALLIFLALLTFAGTALPGGHHRHKSGSQSAIRQGEVPAKALEVYRYVLANGRAPEGYVGGRRWENRERRLPLDGSYREYDVNPKVRGVNRGAERIIVESASGKGWYTGDHYRTFTPIPQQPNR